jgi:xanthine dehydrogenase small subunit
MHVVTIEGLNDKDLSPVQQAMAGASASQCGFCTPGFVVSLTGFAMCSPKPDYENALASISGNICRCTGYKSIERAADSVCKLLQSRPGTESPINFALQNGWVPKYFAEIPQNLQNWMEGLKPVSNRSSGKLLGGGTDLYVQQPESMRHEEIHFISGESGLKEIWEENGFCHIGAACTVTDLLESQLIQKLVPGMDKIGKLVSSLPIRNIATIAGNFVNASPIGDFSILFLSMNVQLQLEHSGNVRIVPLRQFFKGYKIIEKTKDEMVTRLSFPISGCRVYLHFEKVCKRTWLDIASVNMALFVEMEDNIVQKAGLSAGGVGPVPLFLSRASALLTGKRMEVSLIQEVLSVVQEEISPISDVRGSAQYKRMLLNQLIKAALSEQFNIPVTKDLMEFKA